MFSLGYGFALGGYGRRRGAKKKQKKPKENWFERLKVDELKSICRAAQLPIKGTKKDIIARLLEDESTSSYGLEGRWVGTTIDGLKRLCAEKNLVQSGTKLTLVVRLLEHEKGSNPEATAAATKRPAAATTNADGSPKKKRKTKPTRPDLGKIAERVLKKITACHTQKKYQSHWGSKCHAPDLYHFIETLIDKECIEKGFITSDPLFALQIAESALKCLSHNFNEISRPGYDELYIMGICKSLEKIVKSALPLMSDVLKMDTVQWIEILDANLEPFGLGEDEYGRNLKQPERWLIEGAVKTIKKGADAVAEGEAGNKDSENIVNENSEKISTNPAESTIVEMDGKVPASSTEQSDVVKNNTAPVALSDQTSVASKRGEAPLNAAEGNTIMVGEKMTATPEGVNAVVRDEKTAPTNEE